MLSMKSVIVESVGSIREDLEMPALRGTSTLPRAQFTEATGNACAEYALNKGCLRRSKLIAHKGIRYQGKIWLRTSSKEFSIANAASVVELVHEKPPARNALRIRFPQSHREPTVLRATNLRLKIRMSREDIGYVSSAVERETVNGTSRMTEFLRRTASMVIHWMMLSLSNVREAEHRFVSAVSVPELRHWLRTMTGRPLQTFPANHLWLNTFHNIPAMKGGA